MLNIIDKCSVITPLHKGYTNMINSVITVNELCANT
jgi:hypothetical protein